MTSSPSSQINGGLVMAHKHTKRLSTGPCYNPTTFVPCSECPFRAANHRCMDVEVHRAQGMIPHILGDEATWRLWCEVNGYTPVSDWMEEEAGNGT